MLPALRVMYTETVFGKARISSQGLKPSRLARIKPYLLRDGKLSQKWATCRMYINQLTVAQNRFPEDARIEVALRESSTYASDNWKSKIAEFKAKHSTSPLQKMPFGAYRISVNDCLKQNDKWQIVVSLLRKSFLYITGNFNKE